MKGDKDTAYATPYFNDDVTGLVLAQAGETLVYGVWAHNTTAADAFLLFFDAAATGDVTLATTARTYVFGAPTNGVVEKSFAKPLYFANGLVIASCTQTDNSTTAAQDVSLEIA